MSGQVQSTTDIFLFGPPDNRLFGALHEAETYAQRDTGVVICYPFGNEYLRSHRACRHLATHLARVGFPVLRFDYQGTGDSAGEAENATLANWLADIELAIDTLRDRTGVETICLVGLRLGASLAIEGAANRPDVGAIVAWEPIISGRDYLAELTLQQQELLWRYFDRSDRLTGRLEHEMLGFPLEPALRRDIEQLDLHAQHLSGWRQVLVVESEPRIDVATFCDRLAGSGINVTRQQIPSFPVWRDDVDKGLVPEPTLRAITAWAEETLP